VIAVDAIPERRERALQLGAAQALEPGQALQVGR
jgi:Zn-dependent alcohol dehydrogenase